MAKSFFITSSGTGIGKTLVTAALTHQLLARGHRAKAIKPIISGYGSEENNDTTVLLKAEKQPATQENIERVSPWRFSAPISPDMAAHREKREINVREVSDYCQNFCAIHEGYILIEGVGGVMVPLNDRETVLDLMLALKIPTLLVTGSYLGTISHTLTAYKALTNNGITVKAIIISESLESPVPLEELAETMLRFAAVPICIAPRINEHMPRPWEHMPDLTHLLEV